jgi:hypothetical protein
MLDSDESTVITTSDQGNVPTPGSSTAKKFFVQNFGTSTAEDVVVTIEAVGTNDGADYTQIAADVAGSPGTFSQSDVNLGDIAALDDAPFWAQIVQPSGLTADNNPRRSSLVASGTTV